MDSPPWVPPSWNVPPNQNPRRPTPRASSPQTPAWPRPGRLSTVPERGSTSPRANDEATVRAASRRAVGDPTCAASAVPGPARLRVPPAGDGRPRHSRPDSGAGGPQPTPPTQASVRQPGPQRSARPCPPMPATQMRREPPIRPTVRQPGPPRSEADCRPARDGELSAHGTGAQSDDCDPPARVSLGGQVNDHTRDCGATMTTATRLSGDHQPNSDSHTPTAPNLAFVRPESVDFVAGDPASWLCERAR
jgi:hypothetical protein